MKIVMLFIYLILFVCHVTAGEVTKFRIFVETEKINSPVSVPLEGINYNTDEGELVLYEITAGGMKAVPSQLEPGHSARLWFVLEGVTNANTSREFLLKSEIKGEDSPSNNKIELRKQHNDMQLLFGDLPVLSYRFGTKYPPEGVNPLFKRSGYIHPLWSPGGEMLTRIQPPDHHHHYGIWGPWTKTNIDGREVDFWNLAKGEGTVEFAGFISKFTGEIFSGFQAHQKHMDFGGQGKDQVAMNEILDVRVWNTADQAWVIDYTHGYGRPWIRLNPTPRFLENFRPLDVDSRFEKNFQSVWYYNTTSNIPEGASVGDTAIWVTDKYLTQADVDAIKARLPGVNLFTWHHDNMDDPWYRERNIFPNPWKFDDNKRPSVNEMNGSRNFIVYKLSKTYLVAAEAMYMRDGNGTAAVEYINTIRRRAAHPGMESEMEITAGDVDIDFILDERSRELFGEYTRWKDLKRTGKLLERVRLYNPDEGADNIRDIHVLRPIPANQLIRTSNDYGQNPGY